MNEYVKLSFQKWILFMGIFIEIKLFIQCSETCVYKTPEGTQEKQSLKGGTLALQLQFWDLKKSL